MLMASPQWMFETDLPDDIISNSLRFNDGDSAHLTFTPGSASSATDRRKITHSVWVKRSALGTGTTLYSSTKSGGSDYYQWRFSSDDKMTLILDVDDSNFGYDTTAVYRDTTNWYHFVLIIDTTQSTDTDRVKLYANGVLQTISNKYGSNVSQNFETYVMDGTEDAIGEFNYNSSTYFDGYMAEFVTIIGQNTAVTDFGKDVDGVWLPKDTSGLTFGGNGFRLQFKQTGTSTDASGMGADTSGNTNHFAPVNLAAGDVVIDTPENNFCTWNFPLSKTTDAQTTFSEGSLKAHWTNLTEWSQNSTFYVNSGRWYWEVHVDAVGGGNTLIGVIGEVYNNATYPYNSNQESYGYLTNGDYYESNSSSSLGASYTTADTIGIALDCDNGTIEFFKNNVSQGSKTGTGLAGKNVSPMIGGSHNGSAGSAIANYGQDDTFAGALSSNGNTGGGGKFRYTPPTGFNALCSRNLDEPAFSANPNRPENADDNFNTLLYSANSGSSGAGSSTPQDIGGLNFKPDWVWIKGRSYTDNHISFDSIRGVGKYLIPNLTNVEATQANTLDEFRSDGFGVGADSTALLNYQTNTYVAWNWKANGGTTTTNDASVTGVGTIDSVYQANPDAGFSIVTYTGTGSAGTLAHGLSSAPTLILVFGRSVGNSQMLGVTAYNGWTHYAAFHTSSGYSVDDATIWNDVAPTSTVFSVGTAANTNQSSATYVAYCFHDVEGYSKISTYKGNSNADGTYINTGFSPAWVGVRKISAGESWIIFDNARDTFNVRDSYLRVDTTAAETVYSGVEMDFLSNGFKLRGNEQVVNDSSHTFIYLAFAKQPFKYSNAA